MVALEDWNTLKSVITEGRPEKQQDELGGEGEGASDFIFNRTDVAVLSALLKRERMSLQDLRSEVDRSRVSVYLSLKKLREFSLIDGEENQVWLQKDPIVSSFKELASSGFDLDFLTGERMPVLQSLLEWKTIDQIAVERKISIPSIYKYLKGLKPLLDQRGRKYRIKDDASSLKVFLGLVRKRRENELETFQVWSSPEGMLLKSKVRLEGELTAFSRFKDFGVHLSTDYFYYYVPKKKLSLEDVFVHAIRCSEGEEALPKVSEFYLKNCERMDTLSIDELVLHFDVVDRWFELQELHRGEGKAPLTPAHYLSPENTFLSCSLSAEGGEILCCEDVLKESKLSWDLLFPHYVILQSDPDFRWQAVISRFMILEKRTGVKIPILKKLLNVYTENAIAAALDRPRSVAELKEALGVEEYRLRNTLSRLVKAERVRKSGSRPVRFSLKE